MADNLLIVGAGVYGAVAHEIALSTKQFQKIDFIDDYSKVSFRGFSTKGDFSALEELRKDYNCIFVAIGNPTVRKQIVKKIMHDTTYRLVSLISPSAYVSPSASVGEGCIIEPMATVHTAVVLGTGCLISAGAVINHAAVCYPYCHVDCNATVAGGATVPEETKVESNTVFK